jgi:hypothetical protein
MMQRQALTCAAARPDADRGGADSARGGEAEGEAGARGRGLEAGRRAQVGPPVACASSRYFGDGASMVNWSLLCCLLAVERGRWSVLPGSAGGWSGRAVDGWRSSRVA